ADRDFLQKLQVIERLAAPQHDRADRIVAHHHRQARLLAQQDVEVLQQRAAAREHDPLVHDVRREPGGVRSSAISTASTMALSGSLNESRISSELTTTVFGIPATMSRPFTSIVSC